MYLLRLGCRADLVGHLRPSRPVGLVDQEDKSRTVLLALVLESLLHHGQARHQRLERHQVRHHRRVLRVNAIK